MKILDKIKLLAAGVLITGSMMAVPVFADSTTTTTSTDSTGTTGKLNEYISKDGNKASISDVDLKDTINTIISVAIGLIGLVAVVMMIVGGFQYTMSQGEAGKVKKAKDTIMYGIIGLVVALLSYAIVNFVLTSVFSGK